ncbi:MAG: hypothetical protein DDG60_13480, partial [Anaerolineae bacterium]
MEQQRTLIDAWKSNALLLSLRVQVVAWLPGYLAGMWNAFQSYQSTVAEPAALRTLLVSTLLYSAAYGLLLFVAFFKGLAYRWRVWLMLGLYYFLGAGLFSLSALSGDGGLILFIFLLFSAVFLEHPSPYFALGLAMLNFGLMAWLHLSGQITLPRAYNAHDPTAWISGGVVFLVIGLTTVTITQYLFRSFSQTLARQNLTAEFLALGNTLNQLIVREQSITELLAKTRTVLQQSGYSAVWLGLRSYSEPTWQYVFCQSPLCSELNELAEQSIKLHRQVKTASLAAFPFLRGGRCLGACVVGLRTTDPQEEQLLAEIADDLAYALDTLQSNQKRENLTRIAEELLGERDETVIWQIALSATQNLLNADRAAIYEYDPNSDRLSCPHFSGLSAEYVQRINQIFRTIPGGQLLSNPQPIFIEDVLHSPATQNVRPLLESEGIRAYAVFPLFMQRRLIGAFVAYYRYPYFFSLSDIQSGQTLAHFLIAALQNARLFAETRAKSNEQAALFIAAQEMSANVNDFSALLGLLGQQMATVLNVTSAYILDVDQSAGMLKVLSEYWSEQASPAERKSDWGRLYPLQDFPLIITCARQGHPLILDDDDPRLAETEQAEFREYGVKTKLFLPLIWQGELVGLVELWESRARRRFSQHEIHLVQALASHAASALRTAKLFAAIEAREAYFRALTDNSSEGVAVLSEQGEFKYISRVQEQMLGYENAVISLAALKQKIHPDDLPHVRKAFLKCRRLPNTPLVLTCRIQNRKGRWRVLEATLNNLLADPAIRGIVVNFRDVTRQKQAEEQLRQAYDETLAGWARALELRDKDTEGHTRRVTDLTMRLARAMQIDEEQLVHIRRGALLHDIGKVAIPDSILHKTETLTVKEWENMRRHPQYAYDMLKDITYLRPALDIPYCHHEKWDGTGYPRGLRGKEIPL